ncbi:MAG TPA: zinc-ribbon domain-containing protein [Pyrinomonadaceae bacterium]|nr:zinc-ribbon domain-containing protein [Pyrinomonadaceae bacterium]
MVIICQQCSARLQLDDTKVPTRAFTVRCPKCQQIINAQPPATNSDPSALGLSDTSVASQSRFERPMPAPAYRIEDSSGDSPGDVASADKEEVALLLSSLLQRAMTTAASEVSKTTTRRAYGHRRALVCAESEHRFAVARALVENGYEAFVAEDTTQAIERMREDHMDVVILDPDFDKQEQGAAFIKREISALRPAARRRLFFVLLSSTVRSGDPHAAFINHTNLVINPAETEEMPYMLERSIRNFNDLYRDFNKALQVAEF